MPKIIVSKFFTRGNAGTSFGPFIFLDSEERLKDKEVLNHEMIHYKQQVELLFVIHWILYGLFYLRERLNGKDHRTAKHTNPFEAEAYANGDNYNYLKTRKPYSWINYL